jgi:hypothetical protein
MGTKIAQVATITVAPWALPGIAPKVVRGALTLAGGGTAWRYSV